MLSAEYLRVATIPKALRKEENINQLEERIRNSDERAEQSDAFLFISLVVQMKLKIIETFLRVWPQWATCLTVNLMSVSMGLMIGWTSPYVAQLTQESSTLFISDEQASWVVSLLPLGRIFGATAGSLAMEYYGSKRSLLTSGIPMMISWICMIFTDNVFWLYVSRISAGFSFGMFYSCFALYMGEIAAPNIRGALVSTIVNGMPVGTLIGNIMGSHVSMMWFGLVSLALTISFMTIFPLLPQSPHYYVRHNLAIEAKKTIQWYHRKSNVNVELEVIEDFVRCSASTSIRDRLCQITEKKNRRVFSIIILLFIFMQLSGLNTVMFYMEIIVRNARVTSLEPATVVIISSGIGIVVGWISVYLIDRCGRRVLMAVSCGCVIMGMVLLGLHFMLLDQNFDPKCLEWLPIVAMILFMMMSIGLVPVPSTILSELFPDDLKSIAGFTASITSALFAFICSRTYQPLVDLMSEKYVFWMYAMVMAVCLVYTMIEIPETKGKTLQPTTKVRGSTMWDEERNQKVQTKVLWPQWIAGFGVFLLTTQLGLMCGWSSPHVHLLTSLGAPFPVTMSEMSWVVALLNYGRFLGAIAGAVNINYFGSKTAVLISGVPGALSWLFIIVANNVDWLYSSRFFGGICVGMTYSCYSLYVGEIADASIRGALVALATCGIPSGTFLMSVMGAYLPMQISAAISLVICIVLIGIFIWLPESPHHFTKKKLPEKAKSSIQWYHRDCDVETEFAGLQKFIENLNKLTLTSALGELIQHRKSLFIISCLIIYSQWCGLNTVLFYMESILTTAKVSAIPPATVVIIVMPCGMAASCLAMVLMDRIGRKPLMIASCAGITMSFVMLTIEFQLLDLGYDSRSVEGVPIAAMILFYMAVSLGVILVPQTVLGEVFAPHLKWLAACIISSIAAVAAIVSASTYLPLLNALTERYLFLFFAVIIVTAVPFTIFCVPETKGMSLQDIQKKFGSKSTPRITPVYVETDKFSRGKIAGPFIILPGD